MATIAQKIQWAKTSQYLAQYAVHKGEETDSLLPSKIYAVRKSVEWMYGQDPTESSLETTIAYLLDLCGIYLMRAMGISGSGGGAAGAISSSGTPFLIEVFGSDFEDATNYHDSRVVAADDIKVFWNDINRFLTSVEFARTVNGIEILVDGFDAEENPTYDIYIYLIND